MTACYEFQEQFPNKHSVEQKKGKDDKEETESVLKWLFHGELAKLLKKKYYMNKKFNFTLIKAP